MIQLRTQDTAWRFLLFSHGWTWAFWAIPLVRGGSAWSIPNVLFLAVGGLGVPLGGIALTAREGGRAGLRDLGWRLVDPRRIAPSWWGVIVLLFPLATLAGAGAAALLGGDGRPLDLWATRAALLRPGRFLLTAGFVLLAGPLPEEIGWRGYLQDRLQRRLTALAASLLVGVAWATWHWPLYFLEGYYAAFGVAPPHPAGHAAGILTSAVLYAWVYLHTGRSVLAVVLLHFMENFTGELLHPSAAADRYELFVLVVVAALVVARAGASLGGRANAGREGSGAPERSGPE